MIRKGKEARTIVLEEDEETESIEYYPDRLERIQTQCFPGSRIRKGKISIREAEESFQESQASARRCYQIHSDLKRSIIEREKALLRRSAYCPWNLLDSNLGNLRPDLLKLYNSSSFDNYAVTELDTCVSEAIFYSFSSDDALPTGENVPYWFEDLKPIGGESVEGRAYKFSLRSAKDFGIIKVPRNPANTEFIHELFIGRYGTNQARRDIPNFSYVYGGFYCSPVITQPIAGTKKEKVVSFCTNKGGERVFYVVYEYIDGPDIRSATPKMDPNSWFSIMCQITLATLYGARLFDWTHYDLHDENVLLRQISDAFIQKHNIDPQTREFAIKYPIDGDSYYVRASEIATIIDYGRSHVKYNGMDFGNLVPGADTYPVANPLFDVYKFLMFSALSFEINGNNRCLEMCLAMARFFFEPNELPNLDAFKRILREIRSTYYNLPSTDLSVNGFLNYLRKMDPDSYILSEEKPRGMTVIGCSENDCPSMNFLIEATGLKSDKSPSVLDFYNSVRKVESSSAMEQQDIFMPDRKAFESHTDKFNKMKGDYNRLLEKAKRYSEKISPRMNIFSERALEGIQNYLSTVSAMIYLYNRISIYISAAELYLSYLLPEQIEGDSAIMETRNDIERVSAQIAGEVLSTLDYYYRGGMVLLQGIEKQISTKTGEKEARSNKAYRYYYRVLGNRL